MLNAIVFLFLGVSFNFVAAIQHDAIVHVDKYKLPVVIYCIFFSFSFFLFFYKTHPFLQSLSPVLYHWHF